MKRLPITLQINVTELDMPFLPYVLPHQLQAWGDLCSEILVVIDPIPERKAPAAFVALLLELQAAWPHLRVQVAQRTQALRTTLSHRFFLDPELHIPDRDWRQAPFFAYLYGWEEASYPCLLHLDADMLLGGNPGAWLPWAWEILTHTRDLLALAPALGPQPAYIGNLSLGGYPATPHDRFSTRAYLLDLGRLGRLPYFTHPPEAQPPERQAAYRARFCPPYALALEDLITIWMQAHGAIYATSGGPEASFSLHPSEQGERREHLLPQVVKKLEQGNWPPAQAGLGDIHFSAWEQIW